MEHVVKWFEALDFPQEIKQDFYDELGKRKIDFPIRMSVDELMEKKDYLLNLVYCLSECDNTQKRFKDKGLPESSFWGNVGEIVLEAVQTRKNFGVVGIDDVKWVDMFLQCKKHFRIGCLNFDMEIAGEHECEGDPIKEDDPVVLVHIPSDTRLDRESCEQAFKDAEDFLAAYFPEFSYKCFVCGSWLLDDGLKAFLKEDSNILGFQSFFTPYKKIENRALLRFLFSRTVTMENISKFEAKSSLQKKLQEHIVSGGRTYEGFGFRGRQYHTAKQTG